MSGHASPVADATSPASGAAQALAFIFVPFSLAILVGLELLGHVPTPIHFLFGDAGHAAAAHEAPAHEAPPAAKP